MAVLQITLKTTEQVIYAGEKEWNKIEVIISSQGKAVSGATVSFVIVSGGTGTFNPASGTTDSYGFLTTRFNADDAGRFNFIITASKTGYTNGTATLEILALDKPVSYSGNDSLYLNIIEKRKKTLLYELQEYLDKDPMFYPVTGGSDKINFLTEWNYQTKDFPLIVASSESPRFEKMGFNHIIDDTTCGGYVNVTFGLNIICEEKNILDRITEKCFFLLGALKNLYLYGKYGIQILDITTGSTVTEPYGAKYLYANKISVNTKLEFAYNIVYDDIIEEMTVVTNYL